MKEATDAPRTLTHEAAREGGAEPIMVRTGLGCVPSNTGSALDQLRPGASREEISAAVHDELRRTAAWQ